MRIKPISALSNWNASKLSLQQPKTSTKVPDYLAFESTEKKTVSKGGKAVQVPQSKKTIYPEPSIVSRDVCQTSGGVHGRAKITLRDCHVELIMLGTKHAPAAGVKPGAYLRLCSKVNQQDAPLIPVTDHRDAQRKSKAFCACKKKTKNVEACVREAKSLSGARRRRR
jgi:hypothetical protein